MGAAAEAALLGKAPSVPGRAGEAETGRDTAVHQGTAAGGGACGDISN